MNIEEYRTYCMSKKGVTEHFPFDNDVLVFKVGGKMFALASLSQWEKGDGYINLKCDPDYAEELRAEYNSVQPGCHMHKKLWNSVYIHRGELSQRLIAQFIDHSYELVFKTLAKKIKDSIFQ